ncbi:hypothetical protein [Plebeiibacterium sediminum]|uniref:Uncharacterized protein n=1 Tax=Plebeiibacterium sediminum TaxID=2992112 RepID=A0AAE3M4Y0_9BACT|nr:hypothetical protein [Plebeiobacterium sediminum]MCW3786730.1 hypothetical protein [Plebeiobacterium sediminum]
MRILNKQFCVFVCLILAISINGFSQEELSFSGYVSLMPSASYNNQSKETVFDNLIHNRINLDYQINEKFNSKISFRNRMFWGETVRSMPIFKYIISNDPGWLDMSFNWESRSNYLLNTNVDRLWLEYISGNFQVKFGRQRVNWSKTMIWNPNDIFNSYSYFDFDYPERPGMDGVRMQYYTGVASSIEAVVKVNSNSNVTAAALYATTLKGYDIQFIAGELEQEDWVIGGGYSGSLFNAGFYGEVSYLMNMDNSDDDVLLFSIGGNYMFKNTLMLTTEYLYSGNQGDYDLEYRSLFYAQSSVKNLSIDKNSYVLSLTWPVNPLLNVSMAYMGFGFPVFKNYYVGPTVEYSISDNLNFSLVSQYFSFANDNKSVATYLRLKWNF